MEIVINSVRYSAVSQLAKEGDLVLGLNAGMPYHDTVKKAYPRQAFLKGGGYFMTGEYSVLVPIGKVESYDPLIDELKRRIDIAETWRETKTEATLISMLLWVTSYLGGKHGK